MLAGRVLCCNNQAEALMGVHGKQDAPAAAGLSDRHAPNVRIFNLG